MHQPDQPISHLFQVRLITEWLRGLNPEMGNANPATWVPGAEGLHPQPLLYSHNIDSNLLLVSLSHAFPPPPFPSPFHCHQWSNGLT